MSEFSRMLLIAVLAGSAFSVGFVVGKVASPKTVYVKRPHDFQEIIRNESEYEKVKHDVKLTYYRELATAPKTAPIENAATEEAAVDLELETTPQPKAVEPEKPSPEKMAGALAKVLGSDTPAQVKEVIPHFAVQIAAYPDRAPADAEVAKLKAKGVTAQVIQVTLPNKGTVYRVRVLGFKTRAQAVEFKLRRGVDGIVVLQD